MEKVKWNPLLVLGSIFIFVGMVAIFHHGIFVGVWFDVTDLMGHDWGGLLLALAGAYMIQIGRKVEIFRKR